MEAKPNTRHAPVEVDDLVAMFEQTDQDRKGMAKARRWMGRKLPATEQRTIKAIRLDAGLSQMALAERVGLQQSNISLIESGSRRPEYPTAVRLAEALNVSVEDLYRAFENIHRAAP